MHCFFFFRENDDGTFTLYFEFKCQRTFKREQGGLRFPRSIFFSFRNVRVNAAFVSPSLLDFINVST